MFRNLNTRLLSSYAAVILVCLALVGFGLLLFVPPAWTRTVHQDLQRALQATLPSLRRATQPGEIEAAVSDAAEDQDVRILLTDVAGRIRFDTEGDWAGERIEGLVRSGGGMGRLQGTFDAPSGSSGERWLYVAQLTGGPEGVRLSVVFASPYQRLLALGWFVEYLLPPLLRAGAVALVLSLLMALLVSRSIGRPLRRVAAAALAIARGESGARAPVSGPTEVRHLAESFNSMADKVEAAQRSQRDFVANVSHELKTPLTSIQGFAQALLDGTAGSAEEAGRAARVIHDEADRMRRLADDLLVLARIDAGQTRMARDPVDLGSVLRACVEKLEPQARSGDIELELSGPDDLYVTGDADRLAQVFTNLIDNGIAHTPPGGRVTIVLGSSEDEKEIEVAVADTGEGIPAEHVGRVFERFYQVDGARRHSRGAGLGLAIAQEIILAHGGSVSVESVKGLGSKFAVRLPARPGDDDTTVARRRKRQG
jgi:two-component system OmpR family sensor kinase